LTGVENMENGLAEDKEFVSDHDEQED